MYTWSRPRTAGIAFPGSGPGPPLSEVLLAGNIIPALILAVGFYFGCRACVDPHRLSGSEPAPPAVPRPVPPGLRLWWRLMRAYQERRPLSPGRWNGVDGRGMPQARALGRQAAGSGSRDGIRSGNAGGVFSNVLGFLLNVLLSLLEIVAVACYLLVAWVVTFAYQTIALFLAGVSCIGAVVAALSLSVRMLPDLLERLSQ